MARTPLLLSAIQRKYIVLNKEIVHKIIALTNALIDQRKARTIVKATSDEPGYWFGGGNIVEGPDGIFYLVGRYRSSGDARTGVGEGDRGHELAIFRSVNGENNFEKIVSFSKDDLKSGGKQVISIEGAALNCGPGVFELFVSTEKSDIDYPEGLEDFKKPGSGVWTIDKMEASTIEGLKSAEVTPFLSSNRPEYIHIKDPVVHTTAGSDTVLFFCTHPFGWSSSNSAYCIRPAGKNDFLNPVFNFFSRGLTWDVAVSRVTDVLAIPEAFRSAVGRHQIVFYDGAECIREHLENSNAIRRPRGYSCEEIAGLATYPGDQIEDIERISKIQPLFISPWGTGCSRYIHTCVTRNKIIAIWQQSQNSGAQNLVLNYLTTDQVQSILGKA
jgi:hypothetical protein